MNEYMLSEDEIKQMLSSDNNNPVSEPVPLSKAYKDLKERLDGMEKELNNLQSANAARRIARLLYIYYSANVNAGFTQEQAWKLTEILANWVGV